MKKLILVGMGLSCALALAACGDKESYSKEEVDDLIKAAVVESEEGVENNIEKVEQTPDEEKMIVTTGSEQVAKIRGSYVKVEDLPDLMQQTVVSETDNGYKVYAKNSRVQHNDLEIMVNSFDVIKYLESDVTTNVFRAEEGKSYIMVAFTVQNLGDRASSIQDNTFIQDLLITDASGNTIQSYTDSNKHRSIAGYYLEQLGLDYKPQRDIERLGYTTHIIGYEVNDEYLQPGNQLWLRQDSSWAYGGDKYKLPFYDIPNDFLLPVADQITAY